VNRGDVESFFKTLLLGDFEENQNTAAQLLGGLISLVPVLDQVMDARDITGALFNINQKGGFKGASTDQLVSLGFAAFGAIPEVGSAFKTVFKPVWKERRAAKGAVNGGLQAIEQLLGMRKGGAIGWVRKEVLGQWVPRTTQAIAAVNAALAACISLTEFMATASGWKDWLIPDSIQKLAKALLPGLKGLQGKLDEPLQRASNEIRAFLEDLLGEQAAAVVMAVGQRAAVASAVPATRTRSGHNAAAEKTKGKAPTRQVDKKVGGAHEADASKSAGPVHSAMQRTSKALQNMAAREKGLIGEHIVDYHELKRLGGNWTHDTPTGHWSPETIRKINCDKRPVNISLADLPKVTQPGIDAVWEHDGHYTVTEAKASASIGAVYGLGKFKEKKGLIPVVSGLSPDHQLLHYVLSDSSDKQGSQTPMMQMSFAWVKDRALTERLAPKVLANIQAERVARRTVLITLESVGALEHVEALADQHLGKPRQDVHSHLEHERTREWDGAAIDVVERVRLKAHEMKQASKTTEAEATTSPTKKTKIKKNSK